MFSTLSTLFALFAIVVKTSGASAPLVVLWLVGLTFAEMTNDSNLLLFHLSYYLIAFYIQLLRVKLTDKNPSDPYWKGIKNIFLQLYRVSAVFQSIFSIPVLFLITTRFALISFISFEVIYSLIRPNVLLNLSWIITNLLNIFRHLVSILIILHAADMPVQQVFIRNHLNKPFKRSVPS